MVITVPPKVDGDSYDVVLGDCVLPGFVLGRFGTPEEADASCKYFGQHYNLRAFPLDTPWKRRGEFVLIQGGRSSENGSADE